MKRILVLLPVLALSLVGSGVSLAQENPFVGTWKLNVGKSKYSGEKPPQSATRTVVAQGDGLKVTNEGISADGNPTGYSYATNLDGKDSPISGTGPNGADTVAVTRVDTNTVTVIAKKAGKTLDTVRTVVSKDGKVTTITGRGMNAQGQPISFTAVYEKQ
jgi:hypothetical protein